MEMQIVRSLSISNFKNTFKIVLLFFLSFIIFVSLETLLQNRDSVTNRKRAILALPQNSIDIMIIGNSHAYCTFDPAVMEKTLGNRIINAGLPDQKIDVTYYTFKEMLTRQKPEVVVLEAFVFGSSNSKYTGYLANVDSMDFSLDKIEACFEIYPNRLEALRMCSRLYRCHNNWQHLGIIKDNLKDLLGLSTAVSDFGNGFYRLTSSMTEETIKKYQDSKKSKFTPVIDDYSIGYFKRIVSLCSENGIKLVVTMAPMNDIYISKINYTGIYEKMTGLCKEQGVDYIDFNMLYDKIGLSYDDFEDAFHDAQHLNYKGAEKVSSYFAGILADEGY
jgi:hypothetical protein